jgi:predicted DCC family thiol-disulfide oxidoreductase YuxK/uncharacterized membrane protein YphA (DoxX/SURF4 family)
MSRALERIDYWIFREYAPLTRGLPLYRIVVALWLMLFIVPGNSAVSHLPDSFYTPTLGPARLFSGFPPPWFFWGLDYLIELGAFCLLFGYRTRPVSLILAALLVTGNIFRYSVGKIDHDILIVAILFCMAWSDWGARHSSDARKNRAPSASPAWPQALLMFMISLCMFSAALPKARSGWLNPHLEPCRGQFLLNYIGAERPTLVANAMLSISSHLFWKFLDYSTVFLEGAFIFAMFRLPAMRFIAALACLFHGSIFFSMAIFFSSNLLAYLCLVDFRIFLRYRPFKIALVRFDRFAERVRLVPLAVFVAFLYAGYLAAGSPRWMTNQTFLSLAAIGTLIAGVIALVHLFARAVDGILWKMALPVRSCDMIVLYDGECGLCDYWVQFVLKHDRKKAIRFAPLQSNVGRELAGIQADQPTDLSTVVLWVNGRLFRRSDAACILLRQLGLPWSLGGTALALIPPALRNAGYSFIAAHRHAWFPFHGASCRLGTSEEKKRFLA